LHDEADLAPQGAQRDVAHVVTVDEHCAFGRVVETWDEVDEARLARAGRSDDGDRRVGFDHEQNAGEYLAVGAGIAEVDVAQLHTAAQVRQLGRPGLLGDVLGGVEHLEEALDRGGGLGDRRRAEAERQKRAEQQEDVARERDEFAHRGAAALGSHHASDGAEHPFLSRVGRLGAAGGQFEALLGYGAAAFLLGNMPKIHLVAVSVKDFQEMGMELTPEVEAAIPAAIKEVKSLVESILQSRKS